MCVANEGGHSISRGFMRVCSSRGMRFSFQGGSIIIPSLALDLCRGMCSVWLQP